MENKNRPDWWSVANQKYILDAVQNLKERLLAIETKVDDDKLGNIKNIVESQNPKGNTKIWFQDFQWRITGNMPTAS